MRPARPAGLAPLSAGIAVGLAASLALLVGGPPPAADVPAAGDRAPAAGAPARWSSPGGEPGGTDGATSGAAASLPVPVRPARERPAPAPPAPVRVAVASAGLDVPVVPAGVDARGALALPDDARTAGWYRYGPGPTSPAGATVIAAHVDDDAGPGPFARLRDLAAGARVVVTDAGGARHAYTVTAVESVPKPDVPLGAVFDRAGEPRLLLVTCGGTWDRERRSYSDNVLVTARRAGAP